MEDTIRRLFTEEARAAARVERTEQAERLGGFVNGLGIFVVVSDTPTLGYQWEVRRRDGIVLERSNESFRTILLARYAGVGALAGD